MKVRIQYLGPIRVRLNKKEEEMNIAQGQSLGNLLKQLSHRYGGWFKEEVLQDDEESIQEGLIVTINGVASGQLGGLKAGLKESDIVTILPFFAGGG